ncbi:hypothetical protein [Nostoc sp.]|uniref:hypothetical protein n=1 Tax=Nostoc sp. TaxID=1180 RepID=UPI002FF4F7F6
MFNTPLRVNLVDGWFHPLSEFSNPCDSKDPNSWLCASVIVGSATKRMPDEYRTEEAVQLMLFYKALDATTDYTSLLAIAQHDDSLYLAMINRVREELDQLSEDSGQGSF